MIDISLIIAALRRYDEFERLLSSLTRQTIDPHRFEVIVVDQNDSIDLTPIIATFSSQLTIPHIRSITRGLAHNAPQSIDVPPEPPARSFARLCSVQPRWKSAVLEGLTGRRPVADGAVQP